MKIFENNFNYDEIEMNFYEEDIIPASLVRDECKKYKVPFEVFRALSLVEPSYYKRVGISKLKYHIVLLERFDMLKDLINLCDSIDSFDLEQALQIFRIPTEQFYSILEYINALKKKNNIKSLEMLSFCDEVKSPLSLEKPSYSIEKYIKNEEEEELKVEARVISALYFDIFLGHDDLQSICEKYPFSEKMLKIRTAEYDAKWFKKINEKEIKRVKSE